MTRQSTGEFAGVRIIWTTQALKETHVRLFPESKNRSERIKKKLIKRFGGEFKKVPTIFRTPMGFVAHPAFRAEF